MMRVGVFGAGGRMGREVCRAVADDPELELVAAVDPAWPGSTCARSPASTRPASRWRATSRTSSAPGAEVAVDFTVADAAVEHMRWCAAHGVHAVVGTTGIGADVARRAASAVRALGGQLRDRRQLRHRRRAHDALRRAGRAVHGRRRDHRAPPRRQARRPVGHRPAPPPSGSTQARRGAGGEPWPADRTASEVRGRGARGRGPGRDPHPLGAAARPGRPPGGALRAPSARASPSATTPTTAPRSCPG